MSMYSYDTLGGKILENFGISDKDGLVRTIETMSEVRQMVCLLALIARELQYGSSGRCNNLETSSVTAGLNAVVKELQDVKTMLVQQDLFFSLKQITKELQDVKTVLAKQAPPVQPVHPAPQASQVELKQIVKELQDVKAVLVKQGEQTELKQVTKKLGELKTEVEALNYEAAHIYTLLNRKIAGGEEIRPHDDVRLADMDTSGLTYRERSFLIRAKVTYRSEITLKRIMLLDGCGRKTASRIVQWAQNIVVDKKPEIKEDEPIPAG